MMALPPQYCPNLKDHGTHLWRYRAVQEAEGENSYMRCPGISTEPAPQKPCGRTFEHQAHAWTNGRDSAFDCSGISFPERQCIASKPHLTHLWMLNRERFRCPGKRRSVSSEQIEASRNRLRPVLDTLKSHDDGEGGTVYTVSEILKGFTLPLRGPNGEVEVTRLYVPDALQESRVRDGFAQQMDALLVDFEAPADDPIAELERWESYERVMYQHDLAEDAERVMAVADAEIRKAVEKETVRLTGLNTNLLAELATVRAELAVTTLAADSAEKKIRRVVTALPFGATAVRSALEGEQR